MGCKCIMRAVPVVLLLVAFRPLWGWTLPPSFELPEPDQGLGEIGGDFPDDLLMDRDMLGTHEDGRNRLETPDSNEEGPLNDVDRSEEPPEDRRKLHPDAEADADEEGRRPLDDEEGRRPLDDEEGRRPLDEEEGRRPLVDEGSGESEEEAEQDAEEQKDFLYKFKYSPYQFNMEQVHDHIKRLEEALKEIVHKSLEEVAEFNGTSTNYTEVVEDEEGRKFKVESVLKIGDNNKTQMLIETIESEEPATNRSKRSNWLAEPYQ